jgi:hypothetical protein
MIKTKIFSTPTTFRTRIHVQLMRQFDQFPLVSVPICSIFYAAAPSNFFSSNARASLPPRACHTSHHISHMAHHMSHITHHTSHMAHHMSHITLYLSASHAPHPPTNSSTSNPNFLRFFSHNSPAISSSDRPGDQPNRSLSRGYFGDH